MASLLSTAIQLVARDRIDEYANCTIATCPIDTSYYFYRVSLAANATFIALFSLSFLGFVLTYAFTRRATAFTVAMFCGVILEVIGYAGRIMSWQNQWKEPGFLMQIVCLTIAPAFMAGGIYLCLRRIVYAFGPENSRIKPESYTRIVSLHHYLYNLSSLTNNSSFLAISFPSYYKPPVVVLLPPHPTNTRTPLSETTSW
jgi:hypothetical protein